MSRREDPSPVLEADHRALCAACRNPDPEEMVQGQELGVERIAGASIRHRRLQGPPIQVVAFRQSRQIMKVPEVNPSAPVVPFLEEVVHHPVQGSRMRGRNFHAQAITFDETGLAESVCVTGPQFQHSSILPAGQAPTARRWSVAKLFEAGLGGRLFGRLHSQIEVTGHPAGDTLRDGKKQGYGPLEQERNDLAPIQGCDGFSQLGAQAQVPFPVAVVNKPKILAHVLRQALDLAGMCEGGEQGGCEQSAIGERNYGPPIGPGGCTAAKSRDQRIERVAGVYHRHAIAISSTASSSLE